MRCIALLLGCLVFFAGCSSAPSAPVNPGPCAVVGWHDVSAGDPQCVVPNKGPGTRRFVLDGRTVTYFNYDGAAVAWIQPKTEMVVKPYPHTHVEVHRYADGSDIVAIEASEACHVEVWDTHPTANLGCARTDLSEFRVISRAEAETVLSPSTIDALERNAVAQGGRVMTWAMFVVTPDPVQPDGKPYTG